MFAGDLKMPWMGKVIEEMKLNREE